MAIANLLINVVMAGLLLVTIGYCWVLNRRIKVLQDSKSELAQLLKHFDESTLRASESIIALQTASKKIGENIQTRIDKANYVLDDLSLAIDKGNKLNNQIEASVAVSRARSRVMAEQPAEQDVDDEEEVEEVKPVPVLSSKEKTTASLEAVLKRVVGRSKPAVEENEKQPPRSRSEQELLNMLKAGLKG